MLHKEIQGPEDTENASPVLFALIGLIAVGLVVMVLFFAGVI
ncbi:MAG: hypothetical protein QME25_05845 [Bacteroidota bacterium]|nr:hypothetical protein [Bacteroidota bacterium]